jgi:hypothetical protein
MDGAVDDPRCANHRPRRDLSAWRARSLGVGRHHRSSLVVAGYPNTSSSGTPNTPAIWKAISSEGEYRPCSMAMIVYLVTPTRSASSAG